MGRITKLRALFGILLIISWFLFVSTASVESIRSERRIDKLESKECFYFNKQVVEKQLHKHGAK